MNKIIRKERLNPSVTLMEVSAPLVAKKAEPGQFIILRVDEKGERIPLTVADYDREKGTITIIFQIVGATTEKLNHLEEGDFIHDFVGPLGRATHTEGLKKVAVVGGGVGCAIAYPVAKKLYEQGTEVHAIVGFRSQDLVILEDEFAAHSTRLVRMSDDGSWGEKGLVTDALKKLIESGEQYDEVITIGPLIMMKFVCLLTKQYGIKTVASMNPIMVDGTGMCGGCRLTVGGVTKFACVDGPEFDGHEIDFDEAMARGTTYRDFERRAREETCNVFREAKEVCLICPRKSIPCPHRHRRCAVRTSWKLHWATLRRRQWRRPDAASTARILSASPDALSISISRSLSAKWLPATLRRPIRSSTGTAHSRLSAAVSARRRASARASVSAACAAIRWESDASSALWRTGIMRTAYRRRKSLPPTGIRWQ